MKQEIKSELSRQRITQAAIEEFGKGTFDSVSVTQICTKHHIAKGLLYHYFRGKDELYIACVKKCFEELETYLEGENLEFLNLNRDMVKYMKKRQKFFEENPNLANIFFQSIIYPPEHLLAEVRKAREGFDKLNDQLFFQFLDHVELRDGIKKEEALGFFKLLHDSYHAFVRNHAILEKQGEIRKIHEENIFKTLEIMLYGIAKKKEDD